MSYSFLAKRGTLITEALHQRVTKGKNGLMYKVAIGNRKPPPFTMVTFTSKYITNSTDILESW